MDPAVAPIMGRFLERATCATGTYGTQDLIRVYLI